VQSDEELDVSVDEICTDPESRTSAHSDVSLASGLISNLSSHGSPEGAIFDVPGGMPKVGTPDQDENFHEISYTVQTEATGDVDGPVEMKMSLLNVEDEQEGNSLSFYFLCVLSMPKLPKQELNCNSLIVPLKSALGPVVHTVCPERITVSVHLA